METQNFQKPAAQAAVAALLIGLGSKPRENPIRKPTMTAEEFAEKWHLPINKNGVIVGPCGHIYQDPEPLLAKLLRILMGLPNTQPLMFVTSYRGPESILDGGKDNSAWYAIRKIGLSEVSDKGLRAAQVEENGAKMCEWHFEFELSERLSAILHGDQKFRNVISLPSRTPMGKDAA